MRSNFLQESTGQYTYLDFNTDSSTLRAMWKPGGYSNWFQGIKVLVAIVPPYSFTTTTTTTTESTLAMDQIQCECGLNLSDNVDGSTSSLSLVSNIHTSFGTGSMDSNDDDISGTIVGGREAVANSIPWQVGIKVTPTKVD